MTWMDLATKRTKMTGANEWQVLKMLVLWRPCRSFRRGDQKGHQEWKRLQPMFCRTENFEKQRTCVMRGNDATIPSFQQFPSLKPREQAAQIERGQQMQRKQRKGRARKSKGRHL
jgi:hypothetical protein